MRLTLKKESLAELTVAELGHVVGADAPTVRDICTRPTLTLTCGSEVDACITARGCTL